MQTLPIRIGTRGSRLALIQAEETKRRLIDAHGLAADDVTVVPISTTGDRIKDRSLSEIGGKGLFTKEIEAALLDGEIDLAVHSMKDMPTVLPDGLIMGAMLPREDPRDAFLSMVATRISDLPPGSVLGTSSVRRRAQVKRLRPDILTVEFRGNVDTRLSKLRAGVAQATLLASAGLKRMGLDHEITSIIEPEEMLPALAQGAIGLELRQDDERIAGLLAALDHGPTSIAVLCERSFLGVLDGSCRTPIAGLCQLEGERIQFRGMVLAPDGSDSCETVREGLISEAAALGRDAGEEILRRAGKAFFTEPH
ncbi:hydroxymethylbilane synthase [Rhodoligotrophos appendicifer]|uniref:hydroxymethylbilane synthase n=1 Tax=Rhodoligotrophos appendicifer TaxID=987056 RepID=UPI001180C816|nr:hydroxymethylbilane synthase [Rhodoligotrophos appendicifer]